MPLYPYIQFLRYSLTGETPLPESSGLIEWQKMLIWAEQQAIVGIIYGGIVRAGKAITMPFETLMEWIGFAQQIEIQNRLINRKCVEVVKEYNGQGLACMVLKGQGNAQYYPEPLRRTPGDIDLLIANNVEREGITQYVISSKQVTGGHFHHIEYNEDGIQIEVHYFACSQNNPIYMRRLNEWLEARATPISVILSETEGAIFVPSWEYNVVYQLAHMMHHFFDEGIGLRQMIDYYYLLKSEGRSQMEDFEATLRYLGLWKFAGAVMYIMKEVLGLDEQYLIALVDEKRGKTLLNEILKGGNFGHSSNLDQNNVAKKYLQKTWRNLQFASEYPAEALCEPVFRTWHFLWRIWNK